MRFLEREPSYRGYYYKRRSYYYLYQFLVRFLIVWTLAYALTCIFLYLRQDYIVYKVNQQIAVSSVSDRNFQLDNRDVGIDVPDSKAPIHGWWFDAPSADRSVIAIANEPANILTSPKTILYLCGRSGSKSHCNNLARIKGFQQLGFSVLGIDYRGDGGRQRKLPDESQLNKHSQAAWDYLTNERQIAPQNIVIYGESLGGALAIDLAVKQDNAAGVIVQSSFTSMADQIKQLRPGLTIFPLELILRDRFNSIDKVRSLSIPVLFLHGTADSVVDYKMSRQLYYAAGEPKALFYIPEGEHSRLYRPGKYSYLMAIENFISLVEQYKVEQHKAKQYHFDKILH